MIAIKSYSKSKNSDGGATSGKTSAINLTVADSAKKLSETHTIWGQDFNGTQDVDGDLISSGEVKASNGLSTQGMKIAKDTDKTTFTNGTLYQFDANVKAPKFIGDVEAGYVEAENVNAENLVAQEGQIDKLYSEDIEATKAYILDLLSDNITVDTLTVTKAAHFFSLIIDEIKSVGGQIILSPANATLDMVRTTASGNYKCYFRAQVGDEKISNQFVANDQVVCQTFNVAEGVSYNVSNTFYWRKVMSKGTETIDGQDYHYILLSGTDCAEDSGIPQEGDKVVTLGNRNTTDRQNAIVLSAYNSEFLDKGIKAPSLVQYSGINDYTLSTHRLNIISKDLNEFHGNFKIATGEDVGDLINTPSYKVKADTLSISVSKDGELSTNSVAASLLMDVKGNVSTVTVVPFGYTFQYVMDGKVKTTYSQYTRIMPYSDFTKDNRSIECRLQKNNEIVDSVIIPIVADGMDGDDAEFYKLRIVTASATVSIEDKLGINITAEIWKVKGASQTRINTNGYYVDMISNSGDTIVLENSEDKTQFYYTNDSYISEYSKQATPQKFYSVRLWITGASRLDVFTPITVTFEAGSIFQVKDDAINAAVTSVSGDIARIEMKADSVTSTVANLKVGGKNLLDDSEFLTYDNVQDTTWQSKGGTASKGYGYMNQMGIHAISKPSNVGTLGYLDLAQQVLEYKLEPDKEYTFSFYAKGNDGSSTDQGETFLYKGRITTFVYPDVGAVVSDNANTFMLTSMYQRYSYTFRTKSDLDTTATYYLLFRLISEETDTETYYSNAYICMPKLEEGNMASAWDTNDTDIKTVITQTANAIESQIVSEAQINSKISQSASNVKAEVYNEMNQATGIDIANGSITLNANRTTVNGNLSIRNSNEGLVVYNGNGLASVIIQNKQIPSISNLNQSVDTSVVVDSFSIDYGDSSDVEFDSSEISMGYFNVGDTLEVGGNGYLYYPSTQKPIPLSSSVYYKYSFIVTNKSTGTRYESTERNVYTTGNLMDGGNFLYPYSFTVSVAGNYSVMLIIHLMNEPTTLNYAAVWFAYYSKTVSEYTQIGTDGLVSVKGENKYLYYGNDGFVVRSYDYNGLRVSDYNIEEIISYNGGDTLWGNHNSNLRCVSGPAPTSMTVIAGNETIGTRNVVRADSDYYNCDAIILKNLTSEVWIKLPPPYYVNGKNYTGLRGKSLKIKNLTSQRCYVYIQDYGYKIYAPDSTSSASYYNIGQGAAELLWTGTEWLWFRCT